MIVPVVGENLGVTCGNILARSYELLSELQPDAYLVLGDTNSCLSAISAKRLHIPLFHMEAGNRCKDECLPEETNRRIVDIISDVNLCYSEPARKYLHECGMPKERTYMTGSPMAEVLRGNLEKIKASDVLQRLGLEKDKNILLSAHREENIDTEKNFLSLFTAINRDHPFLCGRGTFMIKVLFSMLNFYFTIMGPGSSPDPNIYYRTIKNEAHLASFQFDYRTIIRLESGQVGLFLSYARTYVIPLSQGKTQENTIYSGKMYILVKIWGFLKNCPSLELGRFSTPLKAARFASVMMLW